MPTGARFSGLVPGVQVEMDARRDRRLRVVHVQRDARPDAVPWLQPHDIVVGRFLARHVVESSRPELDLGPKILDAEHDRPDANH
jgi:hypothetical protein